MKCRGRFFSSKKNHVYMWIILRCVLLTTLSLHLRGRALFGKINRFRHSMHRADNLNHQVRDCKYSLLFVEVPRGESRSSKGTHEDLDNVDSLEAYCLTICRNLSLDHLKRKDTHTESLEKAEMKPHDEQHQGPYEQMLQKDRVELIRRLVNHLPEKQRSCMQLRDFEGKSYKEIANILNISEDQVKVNIFRARQVIKQKYQQIEAYGL